MSLQSLRERINLVDIKTDNPDRNQIGKVILDFVGLVIRFQLALVFPLKLPDTFFFIFDPSFNLRHLANIFPLEQGRDIV